MDDLIGRVIKGSPKKITRLGGKTAALLAIRPYIGGTALPPREDIYALLIVSEPEHGDIFSKIFEKAAHADPRLAGFY